MYDIITIGTSTRDIFLTSRVFKILHDPKHLKKIGFPIGEAQCFALGEKIEVSKPIFSIGGGAANAATTFSRQGFKTAALIKIGQDESAENILKELKKEKITPLAVYEKNKSTAFSVILLSPSGERTILVYRGASENLNVQEIPFGKMKSHWAYISPGKIPYPVIEKLFNYFSKNKILIAFNPSRYFLEMGIEKLKPLLDKTKVMILNREEASYLTAINYQKEKEIFKKLDKVISGIAIMTDGPKGVMVSDGRFIYSAGIFSSEGGSLPVRQAGASGGRGKLIDRTGAGDAFASGFVAGLIQKKENCEKGLCRPYNIEYAIRLGSANATSVIEKIGASEGILTKTEFEKSKRWTHFPIISSKI